MSVLEPLLGWAEKLDQGAGPANDNAAWFRQMLKRRGHTQASFARWLAENGDTRPPVTIACGVRRMANGEAKVSGELRVLMSLLVHQQRGREAA